LEEGGLSREEQAKLWQQFEENYFNSCLAAFNAIRKQRELVFGALLETQNNYIQFLERPVEAIQKKFVDFARSYDQFSEEFPELRGDEQTKEELMRRLERLDNDIWRMIEARKEESLAEHQRLKTNGWVQQEMKQLLKYSVKVIQVEVNKLQLAEQLATGIEPRYISVSDAFNRLIDRGTATQDLLDALIDKICERVKQEESECDLVRVEKECFLYRLNTVRVWLQYKLDELKGNAEKVYDVMDDWVVDSVKKENEVTQKCLLELREQIMGEVPRMNHSLLILERVDITSIVTPLDFDPTVPSHLIPPPGDLLSNRFTLDQLKQWHSDMKENAYEEYLDSDTFIHIVVLNLKRGRTPLSFRHFDFDKFSRLI